jgi:hypothetical protein
MFPDTVREERSQHIKGTMGKIEDSQDAKSKGKARGDQEKESRPGDSTHELAKKDIKRHLCLTFDMPNPNFKTLNPK